MAGGGAAGGFVLRAFDSMLKECANKKYVTLQTAIQNYLDSAKNFNQQSTIGETNQVLSTASNQRIDHLVRNPLAAEEVEPTSSNGNTTTALANAGQTLGGAEAELVLRPLMHAFETKNIKVVELALDCLHKLIEYNHLEGDPGLDGGNNGQLFTDILNMVCRCVDNSSQDSTTLHVLKVFLTAIASTKMRVHGELLLEIFRACCNIALNSKSPINQAMSKAMLTQMLSIIFRRMEIDVASSNSLELKEACLGDGSDTMVEVVSSSDHNEPRMNLSGLLFVKHRTDTSLAAVKEMQNLVGCTDIKDLEAVLEKALDLEDGENVTRGIDLESLGISQHDALRLFHALCKMSIKVHSDEMTTKTCILSLELLQGLLEGVSHAFAKNSQFIDLIKAHLSYALLRASVSQSSVMFQHAAGIFSVLLLRFRENFKVEIGVFFPMIVLRSLDGSDLNQKLSVLQMLEKVCKDPQLLVDLYVNYDCDVEAPKLFERMVTTSSKIAQGIQNVDPKSVTATQTGLIKTTSLQCLVNMLKSLVDWERSHRESEKQKKGKESFQEEAVTIECDESKIREDSPINFENLKANKSTIEAVISEFNRQPGKGIERLISSRLVENNPASVAQFLQSTPNLDKAMLGDYLGQREKFPLAVMHAYVDSMNFSGMKFDIAMRELFKRFQLPGEAQKIDRIMEKFAEHYCADNPGLLKNAYTAYVLAYAVLMLNTDAHNPKVCPKMSKSDFIRMNAMNNAEESAPHELFEEIYDSITKEEIKMKGDISGILNNGKLMREAEEKGGLINILNLAVPKSSVLTVSQSNNEEIIKQLQAIIRNHKGKKGVFYTSRRIELVNPMVEALGWPLLATFAVTMGEGDDKSRIGLCMEGFQEAIHISHVLRMDTMRYAFLTSLIRYNYLHAPRDMRGKNVEALRTLLALCDSKIYALQDSWLAILECISRLEYVVSSPAVAATVMQGSNQISRDAILQSLRELAGKPVEKVFVNSIKLPSESVVEFFTALCSVSVEELKQIPARVFSLQKLVEISYYNMARIRMVWARIWCILAQHFIFAGSHSDERVATHAIDSLQQLGMKYLDHAELANFAFQNDVLKPFVSLMRSTPSESIRRLIVDCIVQMIKSNVASMKSGWQSVFMIFTAAADDILEPIVECAFENMEQVILEHFDQVVGECFMDCINCLIGFSKNKSSPSISLKAIALLRICGDRLAEGLIPGAALKSIDSGVAEACDATELYWFPMLAGLSDLTIDPRPEVRNCAIEVLFDILNERGSKFSSSFWESIFRRVLFPIFDNVRHAGKESLVTSGDEWLHESSVHSLLLLCNLFNTFYKDVCFMLPPLLNLLLDCAKKTDQSVVSVSLGALVHLVEVGGHQFSNHDWDTLLKSIRNALFTTQPLELLDDLGYKNSKDHKVLAKDLNSSSVVTPKPVNGGIDLPYNGLHGVYETTKIDSPGSNIDRNGQDHNQETTHLAGMEGSEVVSSPSGRTTKPTDGGGFRRSQTMGQRIMGNMMDNLFARNFTSKSKSHASIDLVPSSPSKFPDSTMEPDSRNEESPVLGTIRSKCITQLLLLGGIDSIQKKYWSNLNQQNRITILEILFSVLEFAASYNSYANLSLQMRQIPSERPPMNLLRQELAGTCIYLDILLKTTASISTQKPDQVEEEKLEGIAEEKLEGIAEEKLVSFCVKVLKEASNLQSSMEETTNMEIHRVLELRTPIFVKVLKGMCSMNPQIFSNHLTDFYPLITELICCDQVEIRRALADLISNQLNTLLP